jgi:hypothetical protein
MKNADIFSAALIFASASEMTRSVTPSSILQLLTGSARHSTHVRCLVKHLFVQSLEVFKISRCHVTPQLTDDIGKNASCRNNRLKNHGLGVSIKKTEKQCPKIIEPLQLIRNLLCSLASAPTPNAIQRSHMRWHEYGCHCNLPAVMVSTPGIYFGLTLELTLLPEEPTSRVYRANGADRLHPRCPSSCVQTVSVVRTKPMMDCRIEINQHRNPKQDPGGGADKLPVFHSRNVAKMKNIITTDREVIT